MVFLLVCARRRLILYFRWDISSWPHNLYPLRALTLIVKAWGLAAPASLVGDRICGVDLVFLLIVRILYSCPKA